MARRASKDAFEWRTCAQCHQPFKVAICKLENGQKAECCSKHCAMLFRHAKKREKQPPISQKDFLEKYQRYMVGVHYAMGKQDKILYKYFSIQEIKNWCLSWVYEKWNDIMSVDGDRNRINYIITLCDREIKRYTEWNAFSGVLSLEHLKTIGIQPSSRKDRPDVRVFGMIELQDAYNKIKQCAGKGVAWKLFYDYIEGMSFEELERKYGFNAHDSANKVAYCRLRLKQHEQQKGSLL